MSDREAQAVIEQLIQTLQAQFKHQIKALNGTIHVGASLKAEEGALLLKLLSDVLGSPWPEKDEKAREQLQALRDEFYAALIIMRNYYHAAISRDAVDEVVARGWVFIKQTDEVLASAEVVSQPPQEEKK